TYEPLPYCPILLHSNSPISETKNTWHRPDPSFTWLFSFFMLLTGIAWGVATSYAPQKILYVALSFVFIHFLLLSVIIATISYFVVGRLLGPGIQGLPGRRRQQGLFGGGEGGGEGEKLEFGYCFDVAIRAFFPVWLLIYVLQFILWPLLSTHYWLSLFFGNTLYLIAATYYFVITFLGYNALPFLNHTQFLLSPLLVFGVLWFVTLFGLNVPLTFAPFMVRGFAARRS
ncbi:MAG: hypothetical protein MMC33_010291, partial [Icmadophila ericetorum]|nr:hypothetical protein [Icmadophila ericetorum]